MIQIRDLSFGYPLAPSTREGFRLRISHLDIAAREKVAIVGRSGCGKTTLLNLLAGLHGPTTGQITIAGKRLDQLDEAGRRRFRATHVGFVFQEFELIEYLTVIDNILLPYLLQTSRERPRDLHAQVTQLLSATAMVERARYYPRQLSQGQRQRTALCRALITRPQLILADEPTGSLDWKSAQTAVELLVTHSTQLDATLVMVTHDHTCLSNFDRVIDLDEVVSQA